MAKTAALIGLAASYEKRFGRATRSELGELARHYAAAMKADAPGAAPAAPIVAHLLGRIAALKQDVMVVLASPDPLPPTADGAATAALEAAAVDSASPSRLARGGMPLSDWIRKSARKDMLAMSEPALSRHLEELGRILGEPPAAAVADAALPARMQLEREAERRRLLIEVEAALHIGWLLQDEFSDAAAHADSESMLLARMTPYEREQYEVRKENARRRQEFRRKRPEIFSLEAARRQARLAAGHIRRSD